MVTGNPVFSEPLLRSFRIKTRTLFFSAVALLCLGAIATDLSFFYFKKSQAWVVHTEQEKTSLALAA